MKSRHTTSGRNHPSNYSVRANRLVQTLHQLVNQERVNLRELVVFHMDECLDWQGRMLPLMHPFNFRGYMERHFYDPVDPDLAVPESSRVWLTPHNVEEAAQQIAAAPIDITYGGLGQDGHLAFNQARRNPYSPITLDELRASTARVQENNWDTIIALAQRSLGCAYQFVPPMSVTLGVKECLSARKVRIFTDTGAWKQTALRMVLFGPLQIEYPATLLQEHPDALITATEGTAYHPISEHPEWDFDLA
jgi:glucosamine-6-phosphate deaminase